MRIGEIHPCQLCGQHTTSKEVKSGEGHMVVAVCDACLDPRVQLATFLRALSTELDKLDTHGAATVIFFSEHRNLLAPEKLEAMAAAVGEAAPPALTLVEPNEASE